MLRYRSAGRCTSRPTDAATRVEGREQPLVAASELRDIGGGDGASVVSPVVAFASGYAAIGW